MTETKATEASNAPKCQDSAGSPDKNPPYIGLVGSDLDRLNKITWATVDHFRPRCKEDRCVSD